jgi:pimeloyl-ACP methyl ester carboxylesterase
MTALAVAYRNDAGAPASPDHRYHLGASEWRDVDAAMAYAAGKGARRIVLVGWSMGGAIVMQAYARSPRRDLVAGIVLDCPVLDWRAVLDEQGRRRHVPPLLVLFAARLVERRIGSSFAALDWTDPARAAALGVPTLLFHGEDDPTVPLATSRAFAAAAPRGLVELEVTPKVGHIGSWYADPGRYERLVGDFCERLGDPVGGVAPLS